MAARDADAPGCDLCMSRATTAGVRLLPPPTSGASYLPGISQPAVLTLGPKVGDRSCSIIHSLP